jgi:hypothetical protein
MLLTMKYFGKRYPKLKWLRPLGPISACVIAIIAAVAGDLQNKGIRIVGHIPKGKTACIRVAAAAGHLRQSASALSGKFQTMKNSHAGAVRWCQLLAYQDRSRVAGMLLEQLD